MNIKNWFSVFFAFLVSTSVVEAEDENSWYVEGAWTHYGAESDSDATSLNGKELFISTPVSDSKFVGYAFMYHDESLYNYFVGPAYKIENERVGYLQLGLGVGKTHFKDYDTFFTVNPWLYWENGRWKVSVHTEYIPAESDSLEWFWRPELQYDIGQEDNWYIGGYGERWLGYGPTLGFKFKWFTFRVGYLFGTDLGREPLLSSGSFASQ